MKKKKSKKVCDDLNIFDIPMIRSRIISPLKSSKHASNSTTKKNKKTSESGSKMSHLSRTIKFTNKYEELFHGLNHSQSKLEIKRDVEDMLMT